MNTLNSDLLFYIIEFLDISVYKVLPLCKAQRADLCSRMAKSQYHLDAVPLTALRHVDCIKRLNIGNSYTFVKSCMNNGIVYNLIEYAWNSNYEDLLIEILEYNSDGYDCNPDIVLDIMYEAFYTGRLKVLQCFNSNFVNYGKSHRKCCCIICDDDYFAVEFYNEFCDIIEINRWRVFVQLKSELSSILYKYYGFIDKDLF